MITASKQMNATLRPGWSRPMRIGLASVRLHVVVFAVLSLVSTAPAAFNPPVIVKVVPSGADRIYFIDRGLDASIKIGDVLNVFREVDANAAPGEPQTARVLLGTMAITASEMGVSLGRFTPDPGIKDNFRIRMKKPVKNDLVIPKLKIDSSVLFEPGLATLQGQVVREELDKVVQFVRAFSPSKLIVEGHTDSDGDLDANQALSVRRAETIMGFLVNNYEEISPEMVTAQGYGETRPLVTNDSSENRALNRRIEIVVWE